MKRGRVRIRESVCVCVCEGERERERERERKREWERERERRERGGRGGERERERGGGGGGERERGREREKERERGRERERITHTRYGSESQTKKNFPVPCFPCCFLLMKPNRRNVEKIRNYRNLKNEFLSLKLVFLREKWNNLHRTLMVHVQGMIFLVLFDASLGNTCKDSTK